MGSTPTRKNNEIIKLNKKEDKELKNLEDDKKSKTNDTGEIEINIYKLKWEKTFTTLGFSNISFEFISKKENKLNENFILYIYSFRNNNNEKI